MYFKELKLSFVPGSTLDDRTITADEEPSSDVVLNEINMQHRHENSS